MKKAKPAVSLQKMNVRLRQPEGVRTAVHKISCGDHRIPVIVMAPEQETDNAPGVLWIHGGGYVTGLKEMVYMSLAVDLVRRFGAVVVSPGYRLAPWHRYPAAVEDCYRALVWLKEQAEELHVRSDQLMVGGESAGGGLCAAVCLMARDRGEVNVAYQMPLYPMLDNQDTDSSRDNHGMFWNTRRNHLGWKCYLGKKEASPYASPARATDYAGLPPCYTFVGDGEPFYRETLNYVDSLRQAGIDANVDVYETNIHAFDMLFPDLDISRKAIEAFNERFDYACKHYFKTNKKQGGKI